MSKHENYEILNLIGYGLAKYDTQFEKLLGFKSKSEFYRSMVESGIADTEDSVKNRQDLFDPFFPNPRKGWWQKGDAYIHRKHLIDALYGNLSAEDYAEVVGLYLHDSFGFSSPITKSSNPIQKSRFKQLQRTGLEAELYFEHNYEEISSFSGGSLDDARLLGDGYDYQVNVSGAHLLAEVKGVRERRGGIRLTENEYNTAREYEELYNLVIVSNLNEVPLITSIPNPLRELSFDMQKINPTQTYYTTSAW